MGAVKSGVGLRGLAIEALRLVEVPAEEIRGAQQVVQLDVGAGRQRPLQVAAGVLHPSALDQVRGQLIPEQLARGRHHAQLRVQPEDPLEGLDRLLRVLIIVVDRAAEHHADHLAGRDASELVGQLQELVLVVLREQDGREPPHGRHVVGIDLEDRAIGRDRPLGMRPAHQAVGADLLVIERQAAGPAVVGLRLLGVVQPAQATRRQQGRLAAPGPPLEVIERVLEAAHQVHSRVYARSASASASDRVRFQAVTIASATNAVATTRTRPQRRDFMLSLIIGQSCTADGRYRQLTTRRDSMLPEWKDQASRRIEQDTIRRG